MFDFNDRINFSRKNAMNRWYAWNIRLFFKEKIIDVVRMSSLPVKGILQEKEVI